MFIDVFFALFLFYGLITGFYRGLVRSLLSIVAFVLAITIGLKLGPYLGDFIARIFHTGPMLSMVIGIVLCFILIIWGAKVIGSTIERGLKAIQLNFLNKIAGALVLGAVMFLFYGGIIYFMDRATLISPEAKQASKTYPVVEKVPEYTDTIMRHLSPIVNEVQERIDEYRESKGYSSDKSGSID